MTERLLHALGHIDELSSEVQDVIAQQIEDFTSLPLSLAGDLAGALPNLPDDIEEQILRARRESPPSPVFEDKL